jgi:hypothetical protein
MRTALLALAVLSAGCTIIEAVDRETEHATQTAALAPGGTLKLKNFSGRVTITAADRQDASIDAIRHGSRYQLDHVKLDIHPEGSTLVINANRQDDSVWHWARNNRVVETEFTISVPRRTNLDAEVFSSPVAVDGLEGSHRVHGFSSRIRLENVTGSVRVHTFSGPVEISTRSWQSGQTIDVETFSGDVGLRLPESAQGTVSFHSFSGHLHSDMPLILRTSSRRDIRAQLGPSDGSGTLRFKTFSGSVRINR